jgi:hypothetical protein
MPRSPFDLSADGGHGQGRRRVNVGPYQPLHTYLRDRFADTVVLTFAQIEDVVGFALPAAASAEREWWAGDQKDNRTVQSDAWTLADRTATVNLPARSVAFERTMTSR